MHSTRINARPLAGPVSNTAAQPRSTAAPGNVNGPATRTAPAGDDAGAPRNKSLFQRLADSARKQGITADFLPGCSVSVEAPRRNQPPQLKPLVEPVLDAAGQSNALVGRLQDLQARAQTPPAPLAERQGRQGKVLQRIAKALPFLRPLPMQSLITAEGSGRPARAKGRTGAGLNATLEALEATVRDAEQAVAAAHAPAQGNGPAARRQQLAATRALKSAAANLSAANGVTALLPLHAHLRADTIACDSMAFAHSEAERLHARLTALHDGVPAQTRSPATVAPLGLDDANAMRHAAMQANVDIAHARQAALEAAQEINDRLKAAQAQLATAEQDAQGAVEQQLGAGAFSDTAGAMFELEAHSEHQEAHAGLRGQIEALQAARADVHRQVKDWTDQLRASDQAIVALHEAVDALARGVAQTPAPALEPVGGTARHQQAFASATGTADQVVQAVGQQARQAADTLAATRAEAAQVEQRMVQNLVRHPPGFPVAGADAAALTQLLQQVFDRPLPANPAGDALAPIAVTQIGIAALATVTRGDPKRAAALLKSLSEQSTRHWIPKPGQSDAPPGLSDDLKTLFHTMSKVPRGMEVLSLLGHNGAAILPASDLLALRTYWRADAEKPAAGPADRDWLEGAKRTAQSKLHPRVPAQVSGTDRAAFTAVRNDMFSRAPGSRFAVINERLQKISDTWVERAMADSVKLSANLHGNKTPFHATALDFGTHLAGAFGMDTPQVQAHAKARGVAQGLLDVVAPPDHGDGLLQAAPTLAGQTARVALEHLQQQVIGERPTLDRKDLKAVSAQVHRQLGLHPATRGLLQRAGLEDPATPTDAQRLLQTLMPPGSTVLEVLQKIADHLNDDPAHAGHRALKTVREDGLPAARQAQQKADTPLRTQADLLDLLTQMLQSMRPRSSVKLQHGGEVGLGLPSVPYLPPLPVVAAFSAGHRRRQEAQFELAMTSTGLHITAGTTATQTTLGSADVGVGKALGPAVVAVLAGGSATRADAQVENVSLRLPRKRFGDDEVRAQGAQMLAQILTWDPQAPPPPHRDLLSLLLATHEDLSVQDIGHATSATTTGEARLQARATYGSPPGETTNSAGGQIGLTGSVERARDKRHDQGGYYRFNIDNASTATQKVKAHAGLAYRMRINDTLPLDGGGRGTVQAPAFPLPLSVTRTLFQRSEKNNPSSLYVDGKLDADHDRHDATPKAMVAEIRANWDQWMARGMEMVEGLPCEQKDTVGRDRVEQQLKKFVSDLEQLGKTSEYCTYNISYTARLEARSAIDSTEALRTLAQMRGDTAEAQRLAAARDAILGQDSTWKPQHLVVREKGKESLTTGLDFVVRGTRISTAEAKFAPAHFPPLY